MTTLDDALRAMLQDRAADIDAPPRALAAETTTAPQGVLIDLPPAQHPRSYRPFLLAAAGVVLLIVGVVTAARSSNDHRRVTPPAHSSTVPAPVVTSLRTCTATVPGSWASVVARSTVAVPGATAIAVVGVTAGGDAVIRYDVASDSNGSGRLIGYVPPGGSTVHHLFTVPEGTGRSAPRGVQVSAEGDRVLVVIGAGAGAAQPQELDLIDVPSGHKQVVARTGTSGVGNIWKAFLQSGHVYWQADGPDGAVRDYDVARATTRVATAAPLVDMTQSGLGVQWVGGDGRTIRKGDHLPAVVAAHVTLDNFASFVTDGRSWAWVSGDAVEWWSPGSARIVRIAGARQLDAVAGSLIFYPDPSGPTNDKVIDTRTGATAPIGTGRIHGHNGLILTADLLPRGSDPNSRLTRVAATDLPAIRC